METEATQTTLYIGHMDYMLKANDALAEAFGTTKLSPAQMVGVLDALLEQADETGVKLHLIEAQDAIKELSE